MKRYLTHILAATLVLSLAACSGSAITEKEDNATQQVELTSESSNPNTDNTVALTDTPTSAPEQAETKTFEPNEDLQVITAFVYDNDTYVVVENVGEQAILNYRIAYINFDKNGFVATRDRDGYERGKADTVNIMPGNKNLSGWYGADGDYAVAAIVGVDYADGTSWNAENTQIDRWAEIASKEFSVDAYKANLVKLREQGALGETNEYAVLTDVSLKNDNRFSNKYDFHFTIENKSEQGILSLRLFVLEFDENGFPVSVSPYDTYCKNGHSTGGTLNLAAGKSSSYSDDLFAQSTTKQVKTIIAYLEFQDGTEWNNPYLYEWIIGNCSTY